MKKKQIDNIFIKIDLGMFAHKTTLAPKFCLLFCLTHYKKQTHERDKNHYRLNRRK